MVDNLKLLCSYTHEN